MKIKNKLIIGAVTLLTLFITMNCHKHNNSSDPCAGVPSSTAQFNTTPLYSYFQSVFTNEDTFITSMPVEFKAIDPNAESYTWRIGDTTITGTNSFAFFFKNVLGVIPVSLTIKKKSDYECYMNDDSVKTYSKNLFFKPLNEWPILGKYRGYVTDSPSDTFTIKITSRINPDNGLPASATLYNFTNGCNDSIPINESVLPPVPYEFIASYYPGLLNTYTCQNFDSAYGYLKNFGDTLIIHYITCPPSSIGGACVGRKTFIGVKY